MYLGPTREPTKEEIEAIKKAFEKAAKPGSIRPITPCPAIEVESIAGMTPEENYNRMVTKKTWQDFRDTGLFMFINTILHAFGWAIVIELNDKGEITTCYPARVKFRGFGEEQQTEMHKKIGEYLKDNAVELHTESNE